MTKQKLYEFWELMKSVFALKTLMFIFDHPEHNIYNSNGKENHTIKK